MAKELFYDSFGEDSEEIVVIVHGLFGSHKNWGRIIDELKIDGRVIGVDLRNHGQSFWAGSMSYEEMAEDLNGVLEKFADKKIHLIGHSMGGKVSMLYSLLNRPANLENLLVVDIAPVSYDHSEFYDHLLASMLQLSVNQATSKGELLNAMQLAIGDSRLSQFLATNLIPAETGFKWKVNLKIIQHSLPLITGFPEIKTEPYPKKTFFIVGADSHYVSDFGKQAAYELFPKSVFISIKQAGHWIHAEQHQKFLETVKKILNRGDSKACP